MFEYPDCIEIYKKLPYLSIAIRHFETGQFYHFKEKSKVGLYIEQLDDAFILYKPTYNGVLVYTGATLVGFHIIL